MKTNKTMTSIFHRSAPFALAAAGLVMAASGCSTPSQEINRNTIDSILASGQVHKRWWKSAEEREMDQAFALEEKADIAVEYTMGRKMDIHVGTLETSSGITARNPQVFDPSELILFFDEQRRKDLVVVIFHKNTWTDAEEKAEIAKVNAYFRDRGYKRIVIQQFRSWGRPTLSDIRI